MNPNEMEKKSIEIYVLVVRGKGLLETNSVNLLRSETGIQSAELDGTTLTLVLGPQLSKPLSTDSSKPSFPPAWTEGCSVNVNVAPGAVVLGNVNTKIACHDFAEPKNPFQDKPWKVYVPRPIGLKRKMLLREVRVQGSCDVRLPEAVLDPSLVVFSEEDCIVQLDVERLVSLRATASGKSTVSCKTGTVICDHLDLSASGTSEIFAFHAVQTLVAHATESGEIDVTQDPLCAFEPHCEQSGVITAPFA